MKHRAVPNIAVVGMRHNQAFERTVASALRWLAIPSSHCFSAAAQGRRCTSPAKE
jgi:hypothetical protein